MMNNYRKRPKDNYFQEASLEDLYVLTESWKNDFELFVTEINFLEQLIDTYFIKLLIYENVEVINELQLDSKKLKKRGVAMLKHLQSHLSWIAEIIEESFYEKNSVLRGQQECFEDEVSYFFESLKIIRYTVYTKLKAIIEAQQPKLIWKHN
jgi:hypothetical protein